MLIYIIMKRPIDLILKSFSLVALYLILNKTLTAVLRPSFQKKSFAINQICSFRVRYLFLFGKIVILILQSFFLRNLFVFLRKIIFYEINKAIWMFSNRSWLHSKKYSIVNHPCFLGWIVESGSYSNFFDFKSISFYLLKKRLRISSYIQ